MNEKQKERTITLNPFIFRKFGIDRNRCLLRVDAYNLSCVPYRFTEKGCVLLLILSPREQDYLQKEEHRNVTFHMEVTHPDYDRPLAQFFCARIGTSREIPGLTIVQLKLECSLNFIDLISPLLDRED